MGSSWSYLAVFTLFLLGSCSSTLTRPPEKSFIEIQNKKIVNQTSYLADIDLNRLEESERQYIVLKSAEEFENKGKSKAACDRFKYLGKDKTFPLRQYALIRSLKACDYLGLKAIMLWKGELKNVKSFWEEEFLKNSMDLALKKKLNDYYVDFAIRLTKHFELHKERETHLLNLLKTVKTKKLKDKVQIVRGELEKVSPRFIRRPKPEDLIPIAKDYSRKRSFNKARNYYRRAMASKNLTPLERIDAFKRYAMTFKLERQKKKYSWKMEGLSKWLRKKKEWLKDPKVKEEYEDIRILTARAQWTVNYRSRAEKTLERIIADPTSSANTWSHAYWLLGKISVEKKKLEEAKEFFKTGLSQDVLSDDVLEKLSWSLGWAYYLEGDLKKAKDTFFVSEKRSTDTSFKRKLRFWQAKILKKLGQTGEAKSIFKDIINEDPYGYYGIASAMEEEVKLDVPSVVRYDQANSPYPTLDWLVATQKFELAEEFLKYKEDEIKDDIEDFLPLYHLARWYEGGIFRYFRLDDEKQEEVLNEHLPAVFPAPHQEIVKRVSQKLSLPEGLIYAIARQESAFNEKVRSWADAFGLLQLTPEKAKSLARKHKIKYKDYNDLYDVETNLTLGSILLKNLAERNEGQFISFVASYNAGSNPVRQWQKSRHRDDPFEFIEMIPYKETRNYIKLVLRNFSTYSRLLGKSWKEDKSFFKKSLVL